MFGLPAPKKKGLLGLLGTMPMNEAGPMPVQTAPVAPPQGMMVQQDMQRFAQPQQPKGPGFFSEGGVGRGIAGAIGDWALQNSGMQPIYAPAMQERRQMAQRQQMMQQQREMELQDDARKRGLDWQDWQAREQWKREHPEPVNNDTVNDFNFYKSLSPQDKAIYDQQHPIVIQGPDGPYLVPRSSMGGMTAPVGGGVSQSDWDNAKSIGGGASSGTGGFPVTGNKLDRVTIQSESAGNPNAVSPKGARGLWQVMPATARDPGFGIRPSNGTPQDDARVGAEYRRAMEKRYGGNLPKMWAAYNWGPGNLDNAIATYGDNWLAHAPAETRNYVARNMRAVRGQ